MHSSSFKVEYSFRNTNENYYSIVINDNSKDEHYASSLFLKTNKKNHTLDFTNIRAAAQMKESVIPVSTVVFR